MFLRCLIFLERVQEEGKGAVRKNIMDILHKENFCRELRSVDNVESPLVPVRVLGLFLNITGLQPFLQPFLLLFLIFFLGGASVDAAEGDAAVSLIPFSTYTLVGEAFALKAVITKDAHQKVEKIILPVTANIKFSVVKHKKGAKDDEVDFELRFFDLGETEAPSPEFVVSSAVIRGKPFKVFVKGRLSETDNEIKKLRPQSRGAFPFAALFAVLAIIAAAAYYLMRKKKIIATPEKQISPEEWYKAHLDALDRDAPADELLDGLSDAFRIYLGKKGCFPAIFLDTRETEKEMKKRAFGTEERIKSVSFLRSCDLAKFAGKRFVAEEIEKLFKDAYSFIGIGGVAESPPAGAGE